MKSILRSASSVSSNSLSSAAMSMGHVMAQQRSAIAIARLSSAPDPRPWPVQSTSRMGTRSLGRTRVSQKMCAQVRSSSVSSLRHSFLRSDRHGRTESPRRYVGGLVPS